MFLTNKLCKAALFGAMLGATAMGLVGCRDLPEIDEYRARRDSITLEHGNAVEHNIAVQTIDPWPPNVRNTDIDMDGERSVIAARRYKENKVIKPRGLSTQDAISVGGGSGGNGSAASGN